MKSPISKFVTAENSRFFNTTRNDYWISLLSHTGIFISATVFGARTVGLVQRRHQYPFFFMYIDFEQAEQSECGLCRCLN